MVMIVNGQVEDDGPMMDYDTRCRVRALALECGFKERMQANGESDLNEYVYTFAEKLTAPLLELLNHIDSDPDVSLTKELQAQIDQVLGN